MNTILRNFRFFLLVTFLFAAYNSGAQIVFEETFTSATPVNATHVTKWHTFIDNLTPRAYSKVVVKFGGVPMDSVTNPTIVQDMAMKLNTANKTAPATTTWTVGSNQWFFGNCGSSIEWGIFAGSTTPCACAVTKVIRAACTGCATNYGGWGTAATCPGPNPFPIRVEFWYGFPCTDTPKSSIRGPKVTCPNKPYIMAPDSFYTDASYKWEYSLNGSSWSNFTGTAGILGEINDSINVGSKWYRVTITCTTNTNLKWTSPPHRIDIAPFYYCYCDNNVVLDAGADIGNLIVINTSNSDTIINTAKLTTGLVTPVYNNAKAVNKYTAYHDSVAWPCLYRDTSYLFRIAQVHSTGTLAQGVAQVYIDYDRDGLYNPNTERVFVQAITGAGSPPEIVQVAKAIPSNAEIGFTGMRVIISKDTVKGAPCDTLSGGGEVEDYVVEICQRPCDGPVKTGVVVSTDTSMCPAYEYRLTDTTYEKARSAFTRAWQVSGDDITWFNIANSNNKDTLERVFTGQPLYYRLRTICLPTHDTAYSVATKINSKPGYKCYCYSKAVGGKDVDTSDIGGVTIAGYSSNNGGPHLLNQNAVRPRTDFTDITPIEIFTDSAYRFTVYHTMPVIEHGDSKVTVFMDFNNNNQYEIPEERIYTGYTTIGNHTLIDNVVVPLTAITDVPTGMRVILNNDVGPNIPSDEACGPYTSGETEDYILTFRKKWGVSVGAIQNLTGFGVHPNPSTGKFHVQFNTPIEFNEVNIRISNITGQVVMTQSYEHKGGIFDQELNMTSQPRGVYFVELETNGQKMIQKLVLQ